MIDLLFKGSELDRGANDPARIPSVNELEQPD
jgi:hypothetical protein